MLEIFLLLEFLKNIFNNNYANLNLNLNNSIKAISYEEFNEEKEKKEINIDLTNISAKNILVKEIKGQTLIEKNSQEIKPIASLTKLITAVIALKNYSFDDEFIIKKEFLTNNDAEKNTKLREGEKFNLKEILNIMLISSSNISAWTLADKMGNDKFLNLMINFVKDAGALETQVKEASGISDDNRSSLNDLFLIIQKILKEYPEIFEISIKPDYFIIKNGNNRLIYNTNYLLAEKKYRNIILGSKTGFTSKAGECLILLVKYPTSPLIFIGLLDSRDRLKDAEYILEKLSRFYE
ncbi:MAG: D-alanyl-D-alanine endopeptidase [Candidatus Parcubacteria bacterium]|nr:MAG: D-alanyl-D-alanine endopeptidase [Candidatus Parcubacteria bacterium]